MSDSGSAQGPGGGRRPPKVGVYVPRHRRNNDETSAVAESSDSRQSSTASSPRQQHSSKNQRDNNMPKEDSTEEGNSSRSGHSSGGEVQRRGRGKFMGPGGSGSTSSGGHGGGNTRGHRDNRNGGTGTSSNSNNGSNSSTASPSQQPVPSVPRHPRGRDFDATVLRRYSDDENKPGSSFSRSSSYSSNRSNNSSNNNGGVLSPMHSSSTRPAGRSHDSSNTKRSDRADEGAWRRDDPKKAEDQDREQRSSSRTDVESESDLSNQLNRIQLSEDSDKKDETESVEELEEWELALQDSDEDAIPRIENSTASKSAKPHPAEHLLSSSASKAPKTGNWSEVANEEMYILELYDFSPAIKTMHLTDMFAPYENRSGGFRIKWIDDTKALVIFESAAVASIYC
ncbi:hypothetical protein BC939DRAFT_10470 [Gamsiella multidivaricata]|uniref:uncharacterized protein n=1 Tax=Gamsiella multidivaricata TaxID=101098 RepID=UPI00221F376A|nr:uncharacterized protein BC939DRAFT_10470 [Gamsiella multidivaricata]KAI7829528.1 hypothetical protein BC939DRAFT_10470 [Gamsiella multidivaricata]